MKVNAVVFHFVCLERGLVINAWQFGTKRDKIIVWVCKWISGPEVVRNDAYLSATTLMLKKLLLVMAECVVQPTESIARLGCACIRWVRFDSSRSVTTVQKFKIEYICCVNVDGIEVFHPNTMLVTHYRIKITESQKRRQLTKVLLKMRIDQNLIKNLKPF